MVYRKFFGNWLVGTSGMIAGWLYRCPLVGFLVAIFLVWGSPAQAMELEKKYGLEPYFLIGNIDFESSEDQGNTHKSLIGIGMLGHLNGDTLHYTARVEKWALAEANDEDMNVVHDGFRLGLDVDWPFSVAAGSVGPLFGVAYKFLNREPQGYFHFNELSLYEVRVGMAGTYQLPLDIRLLLEAVLLLPFGLSVDYGPTPAANPGFDLQLGVEWRSTRFVLYYERLDLSEPRYRVNLLGLRLSYLFSF